MKPASEKGFQQTVIDLAHLRRWLTYHTFDSRHSAAGFLDLVLVRGQRLIFAELKSETGKLSPQQKSWFCALMAANQEVYVWRPVDWNDIQRILE